MTIKEICEASGLTKKAVAYYEEKGLICPDVRENGYREYRKEDVQTLREVACLRFYGLTERSAHSVYGSFIIRLSYLDAEEKGILPMIIAPSDASPKAIRVPRCQKKRRRGMRKASKKRCFTHLQICSMTSTSTLLSAGE